MLGFALLLGGVIVVSDKVTANAVIASTIASIFVTKLMEVDHERNR